MPLLTHHDGTGRQLLPETITEMTRMLIITKIYSVTELCIIFAAVQDKRWIYKNIYYKNIRTKTLWI